MYHIIESAQERNLVALDSPSSELAVMVRLATASAIMGDDRCGDTSVATVCSKLCLAVTNVTDYHTTDLDEVNRGVPPRLQMINRENMYSYRILGKTLYD